MRKEEGGREGGRKEEGRKEGGGKEGGREGGGRKKKEEGAMMGRGCDDGSG